MKDAKGHGSNTHSAGVAKVPTEAFDKLFVVHLQNAAGQIARHETFARNEKHAVKLAQAQKAKALIPEQWAVHKVEKLS